MTDHGAGDRSELGPRPLRLYLASVLLTVVAGIEALLYLFLSMATGYFTPLPVVFALAGVAAMASPVWLTWSPV